MSLAGNLWNQAQQNVELLSRLPLEEYNEDNEITPTQNVVSEKRSTWRRRKRKKYFQEAAILSKINVQASTSLCDNNSILN